MRKVPIMREQRSWRIVNPSSTAVKFSTPATGWHAASKHAVEALSDALHLEVKHSGIEAVLIEPGSITTALPASVRQFMSYRRGAAGEHRPEREVSTRS